MEQHILADLRHIRELEAWIANARADLNSTRQRVIASIFGKRPSDAEGTTTQEYGLTQIKLTDKLNRKVVLCKDFADVLTNPQAEITRSVLDLKNPLFRWKPELSLRPYRKLNDEQRSLLDPFIEVKPATPTLTIEGEL